MVDWPGLMAWSTNHHDGTAPSNFTVMSKEDQEFLKGAMEFAFSQIENPNQLFKEAIQQMIAEDADNATILTVLEVIDKCCDDPDVARNAEKLGGVEPLLKLVQEERSAGQMRTRSFEILAILFSNNEVMQEAGMKHNALQVFLDMVARSPVGSEDRSKAFRGLVSLVRNNEKLETRFLREENGINVITTCMGDSEDNRSQEKAVAFVTSLVVNGRLQEDDALPMAKALVPLFPRLPEASIQYKENVAACAVALSTAFAATAKKELEGPVTARLAELKTAQDPETEREVESLLEAQAAMAEA